MGLWPGCCRTQLRDAMRLKRALSGVEPTFTFGLTVMLSAFGMVPRSAGHLFRRRYAYAYGVGHQRRGGRLYLVGGWVRSCRVCVPGLGAGALRSRTWVKWFRLFRTVNVIMHMHMYHNMHTPHTVGHTKVYV